MLLTAKILLAPLLIILFIKSTVQLRPGGKNVCSGRTSYKAYKYQQYSRINYHRSYHRCGFWGWGRCAKIRSHTGYYNKKVSVVNYRTRYFCCKGWLPKGSECPIAAPVDGKFTPWTSYGPCSVTCGGGTQSRTRTCTAPAPAHGGKDCVGNRREVRNCNTRGCPVDGKFGPWKTTCACTVTSIRKCDSPPPSNGGKDCVGPRIKTKNCESGGCSVDGGFTNWSAYGPCTQTCGGGVMKSTRTCTNPRPSGAGKDCDGPRVRTIACKNDLCPGPPGLAKASENVEKYLKVFYEKNYPGTTPSAKFFQATFKIQKAVREEFVSVDPSAAGKTLDQRLKDLEKLLKAAVEGRSFGFGRELLGKCLFLLRKKMIKGGVSLEQLAAAAVEYLDRIKREVGGDKFSELISSKGSATLMFAIDTSGSMAAKINSAKAISTSIVTHTRGFKVDYILSPFNDPGYGPSTYRSNEKRTEFVQSIANLRANGGGDCPELAFTGMLEAFKLKPRLGSPMFVFTDASAKDDNAVNRNLLIGAAKRYRANINFFINLRGCGSGIKSYEYLARETSGHIFPLSNDAELVKFTGNVQSSLQSDTILLTGGTLKPSSRLRRAASTTQQYTFSVDESVGTLIVSVSVTKAGSTSGVSLIDPTGKTEPPTSTTLFVKSYQISNFTFGTWKLVLRSDIGLQDYSVKAISKKPIEFDHTFLFQENPEKNSPPYAMSNPLIGQTASLLLQVGGLEFVKKDTLKVNLIDALGNYLMRNISLTGFARTEDVFTATFTPPDQPFRLQLTGTNTIGHTFQRVARESDRAGKVFFRTLFAGHEFTVKLNQKGAKIEVSVVNTGSGEEYTVEAAADVGKVSPAKQTVAVTKSSPISLTYDAPADTKLKGKTVTITINATGKSSGAKIADSFTILLVN